MEPIAADQTHYEHLMFVPADRAGETEHWDKSWALIEERVFQREDLWVCEQVQRGLAAGATRAPVRRARVGRALVPRGDRRPARDRS